MRLGGQFNPFGLPIATVLAIGAATDAVMATVPAAQPGGVAPATQPAGGEPYAVIARRSAQDGVSTNNRNLMNYRLPVLTPAAESGRQASISSDRYLLDASTVSWISALSFEDGRVVDRIFFGGTNPVSNQLIPFLNESGILDTFAVLGPLSGTFDVGQFFAPPGNEEVLPFPTGEWFSLMSVVVEDEAGVVGSGVFIKTQATIAADVLDPRVAAGVIRTPDDEAVGWLNIYPGIEDDPATDEVEGIGLARSAFGEPTVLVGAHQMAQLLFSDSIDGIQFGGGSDPSPVTNPDFLPNDIFIDNIMAFGGGVIPCQGDLNGDGVIDGVDLLTLLNGWGPCPSAPGACPGDINGDGAVDGGDLLVLLNGFGAVCF